MDNNAYTVLAKYYDAFNTEVDYDKWAEFLHRSIEKYQKQETALVLDLGCGTGLITKRLAKYGYSAIGIDMSENMLYEASEMSRKEKLDILWLCQDMREFELYGTVGAVVSCLDCINYLTKLSDVKKTFSLVHNYLDSDGIFIFDINTEYKFKNVFGNNSYVYEEKDVFCTWQNYYNEKNKTCDFYLDVFEKKRDGRYERHFENQREKCYTISGIKKALSETGFEIIGVFSDFNETPLTDTDQRAFFIARAIK